jgi:hypothetical protein
MTWLRYWLAVALLVSGTRAHAAEFDFVALGDTAYRLPEDLPLYDALIAKINAAKPAFSIHVGDIWGATPCTQEEYEKVLVRFQTFRAPVVYTPGDNEWVDCRDPKVIAAYVRFVRGSASPEDLALLGPLRSFEAAYARKGYDDVLARLSDIRRIFFPRAESLGRKPMPLTRQSDVSDFKDVPENAKWTHREVLFATVHVPGSQNDFFINDEKTAVEAVRRNRAAIAWLESVFADAKAAEAKAVVIAMHAQLFLPGEGNTEFGQPVRGGGDGPFFWVARAVRDLGGAFGRPVLLVHGDFHQFIVDKPFRVSTGETSAARYDNITRLQVYGAPDVRAVRVRVDTETPWVFGFTPLY